MRRLTGLALSVVLASALLIAPAAASPAVADDAVVLAVEGDEGQLGPDPQERNAPDNRARELVTHYEDPETPFTWGAAWILTFASLVGLALLGGLYYLLVHRPAQEDAGQR
jgi:hypothetical protein